MSSMAGLGLFEKVSGDKKWSNFVNFWARRSLCVSCWGVRTVLLGELCVSCCGVRTVLLGELCVSCWGVRTVLLGELCVSCWGVRTVLLGDCACLVGVCGRYCWRNFMENTKLGGQEGTSVSDVRQTGGCVWPGAGLCL